MPDETENKTTNFHNVKTRVEFLTHTGQFPELICSDPSVWALAICEELDRLEARICQMEKKNG